MKLLSIWNKGKTIIIGLGALGLVWLAACVPTSEPIAIGPTRLAATAVQTTATPVIVPTITNPITT
ncbi:MAG TPA: hypothetical protein PLK31_19955, partial [Chloroflexota bacterium]|nr:hypothetical protein [Chloroflexota bacterium]